MAKIFFEHTSRLSSDVKRSTTTVSLFVMGVSVNNRMVTYIAKTLQENNIFIGYIMRKKLLCDHRLRYKTIGMK